MIYGTVLVRFQLFAKVRAGPHDSPLRLVLAVRWGGGVSRGDCYVVHIHIYVMHVLVYN